VTKVPGGRKIDSLAIALDLIRRGIRPVPVPYGKKNPIIDEWQNLDIVEANAFQYFNGTNLNVGAQMGPKSGGLTDVDLDCKEAVQLGPYFLPKTNMSYGRKTNPMSHSLYICDDPPPKAVVRYLDDNKKTIIELRFGGGGKGAQSVMPGSLHTSGEYYEWVEDGQPAKAGSSELQTVGMKIAVGTMLMRNWPPEGPTSARHDLALGIGGLLARAGWTLDDIHYFIDALCRATDGADFAHDHARTAKDGAEAFLEGKQARGFTWLKETFDEPVAKTVAKLLHYREAEVSYITAEGFEKDGKGVLIKNSRRNILKAMELMGVTVRYDAFHDKTLISGLDGFEALDDAAVDRLWLTIDERFRLLPMPEFFLTVVQDAARYNSFHPVRDYLDNLVWDGVERLDRWLVSYGQAEDTAYVRAVGSIALIAAVRRVRQPGVKFDEMLILESPQGMDKSVMLAILSVNSDWFSDDLPLNADGKKVIEQLRGRWIVEAAELSGMRKSDIEHLKALLSRQVDRARLAYGRVTVDVPRQSIVVGTTNSSNYLTDETGNRRFWPVEVKKFDVARLTEDRDQLWAEAAHREAAGYSIRLDPKLWDDAAEQQEKRTVDDPWFDDISNAIGDLNGKMLNSDAWIMVRMGLEHRSQAHNRRLGHIMKSLGFERKVLSIDGKNHKCYVRGSEKEQELRLLVTVTNGKVIVGHSKEGLAAEAKKAAEAQAEVEKELKEKVDQTIRDEPL
jgi:predicted P-loop ATPase